MQIVAQGAQDKYLTVDPEITFFKSMYRRHTNFAVESIEQTFNGNVAKGGKVSATVARNGDLVSTMWLEIQCQGTAYASGKLAYDVIDNIYVEVGGTRIDRHYGGWMKIWDDLTTTSGKRAHLDDMITGTGSTTQLLRVPLSFWFCKDAGQALPLIALQYHEVKCHVEFSSALPANAKVSLWADYVFLDTAERQRFARSTHEYLLEQVQTTNQESLSGAQDKIRLNFNHPVKELVWTAPNLGKAKLQLNGHDRFAERDAEYFSKVQQYQHHTAKSDVAYVYSFALEPEKHQPSGTCNFSRIDNASLQIETSAAGEAEVFATNYNVLRIKNGMGGLAYSN